MKHAAAILLPLAALTMAVTPATAAPRHPVQREASIPFANHGGVDNWRADGTGAVYFQHGRQWYRATLFMPASDLPFAEHIGIDTGPSGSLDKWGAIYVRGQRYPFRSFEKVAQPPTKAMHRKS